MRKLLTFLVRLEDEGISYTLHHIRDETIMVLVSVAGDLWEIEFFADGSTEVEIYRSSGVEDGGSLLEDLFTLANEDETDDEDDEGDFRLN